MEGVRRSIASGGGLEVAVGKRGFMSGDVAKDFSVTVECATAR